MSDSSETEGNFAGNDQGEPKAAEVSSAANAKEEEEEDDRSGPGEESSTAKKYLEQIIEWEIIREKRWEINEDKKKIQEWWKNCVMETDEKKDPELQIERWKKRDEEEKKEQEWLKNYIRKQDEDLEQMQWEMIRERWKKLDEEDKEIREWWNNVREKDDEENKRKTKDDDHDDDLK